METMQKIGSVWGAKVDREGRTIDPGVEISEPMGAEQLVEKLRSEHGPLTAEEELGIIHFAWGRRNDLPERIAAALTKQGE